jgi:hypothetical protein
MYSPKLQHDQIHQLWLLAKIRKRPMIKVLRQILIEYFEKHEQELAVTVETVTSHKIGGGQTHGKQLSG